MSSKHQQEVKACPWHPGEMTLRTDDLAVPEVHTGHVADTDRLKGEWNDESIIYDTVAIPEVHVVGLKKRPDPK